MYINDLIIICRKSVKTFEMISMYYYKNTLWLTTNTQIQCYFFRPRSVSVLWRQWVVVGLIKLYKLLLVFCLQIFTHFCMSWIILMRIVYKVILFEVIEKYYVKNTIVFLIKNVVIKHSTFNNIHYKNNQYSNQEC